MYYRTAIRWYKAFDQQWWVVQYDGRVRHAEKDDKGPYGPLLPDESRRNGVYRDGEWYSP